MWPNYGLLKITVEHAIGIFCTCADRSAQCKSRGNVKNPQKNVALTLWKVYLPYALN